ncbi:MAG: HEAT repeat domain-containing protein [Fimbriimonadales bacterium]
MLKEYQVHLRSRVRYPATLLQALTDPNSPQAPTATLNLQVRYKLETVPLPVAGGWYRAQWSGWQASGENPFLDWQRQAPLVTPWFYRVRPDGVLELLQESQAPGWYHGLRTSATWLFQWVAPDPKRTAWNTTEPYTSGEVRCEYRQLQRTNKETLYSKRFLGLVNPVLQGNLTIQVSGELRYTLRNRDQVIVAVSGSIREASVSEGRVVSETVNQVQVRLIRERPVSDTQRRAWVSQWSQLRRGGQLRTVVALPSPEEERLARARAMMGHRALPQLIEEIRALDKRPQPVENEQLIPLQLALEGALTLYPKQAEEFATAHLAQVESPSPSFWVILGAVSGSERASAILLRGFEQARSREIQLLLLRQMAFAGRTTVPEFRTLWTRYQTIDDPELRTQMELTLSVWVAGLPTPLPPEAQQFVDKAIQAMNEAEQAEDENRLRYWIGILGNMRRQEVLPSLERLARRGSETLRKTAVEALQAFTQPEVTDLLVKLVPLEPAPAVRGAIAKALAQRWTLSPQVPQILERLVFNDPEPGVRLAVVDALVGLAARNDTALRLLVRISRQNSEERVRRQALIGLAALHAQGVSIPRE